LLKNNLIDDGDKEFLEFKKIAKEFTMTIIPGAFFNKMKKNTHIISPVIGPEGEFIGKQEKIHPFDDEKNKVKPGNEVKIFNTTCKFGIIICYDYP
jgi:predicted amidohydrolase